MMTFISSRCCVGYRFKLGDYEACRTGLDQWSIYPSILSSADAILRKHEETCILSEVYSPLSLPASTAVGKNVRRPIPT